jgi:sterol desaturase/sphingolipid hydroxylase (fatty acid hydroxylase superfamily)
MDIVFGTYICPDTEPEEFGIKEKFPTTYIGQLLKPVLPNVIWNQLASKKES